jgi:hypothetical protein
MNRVLGKTGFSGAIARAWTSEDMIGPWIERLVGMVVADVCRAEHEDTDDDDDEMPALEYPRDYRRRRG